MLFKLQDMVDTLNMSCFYWCNISTVEFFNSAKTHKNTDWGWFFKNPRLIGWKQWIEWKMFDLEMIWICFIFSCLSVFWFRAIIGINAPSWLIVQSVVRRFQKKPPVQCLFGFVFFKSCKVALQYSYLFNPLIPRMSYLIQFSWVFF